MSEMDMSDIGGSMKSHFRAANSLLLLAPDSLRPKFLEHVTNAKALAYGISGVGVVCAVYLLRQMLSASGSSAGMFVALVVLAALVGGVFFVLSAPSKYHDEVVSPVAMLLMMGMTTDEVRKVVSQVSERSDVSTACKYALSSRERNTHDAKSDSSEGKPDSIDGTDGVVL